MKPKRRIYDYISLNGTKLFTLFDTGAQNSYITRNAVKGIGIKPDAVKRPFKVGLGGEVRTLKEYVNIDGLIHSKPIIIHPFVVNNLGTGDNEKPIDVLFGLLALEQWHINLDLSRKKIDLTHYKKEFIEY